MNTTTRAILQTMLSSDPSLLAPESDAIQRLIRGEPEISVDKIAPTELKSERLFVTQKEAAELLSVSRVTIWRMTKDNLLHPVEILPGTLRYTYKEIASFARRNRSVVSHEPRFIASRT